MGDIQQIQLLLDKGDDVNEKNKFGMAALHYAAIYGYEEIVTILLDRGGEVSAKENKGIIAICYAAQKKHGKVFRMLLDKHCRT